MVDALTDNLVPAVVKEEADAERFEEQVQYCPPELIGYRSNEPETYFCYLIELQQVFDYHIKPQETVLAVKTRLESDIEKCNFDLDVDRGKLTVLVKYIGERTLTSAEVLQCQRFQNTVFRLLIHKTFDKPHENEAKSYMTDFVGFDYLLLPAKVSSSNDQVTIDYDCIRSVVFRNDASEDTHTRSYSLKSHTVHTKNGLLCSCWLENSLVQTPHNGFMYCIMGFLDGLNGNSVLLHQKSGQNCTYKEFYKTRHGIKLLYENQTLLKGRRVFTVENCLKRCRNKKTKEPSHAPSCELPPELCSVIMSPISISIFYSFSFLPSIMHRIESLLLASNLKRLPENHCMQNVKIPTITVLEAITTKKCQENLNLESLETLGDSFLKYAVGQDVFKKYQNHREGLLTVERERLVSNAALCKLGCDRKIPGFIRNEQFDPKTWIIPGNNYVEYGVEVLSSQKVYVKGSRTLKSKRIADVVEALIGAYLSTGGESVALLFMAWVGINVDFTAVPYLRPFPINAKAYVNVSYLESLLNYRFRDASYLVEALTHGSCMMPGIPRCYQRLEFLGDSVLDYLITVYLYKKYPGLSSGLLTDLRSACVNNGFYSHSAVRAGLYQHILHASQDLRRHMAEIVTDPREPSLVSTFDWDSEKTYPKVLGDVIESLAGAIFVDSEYNKDVVFKSIRPLLEPMVTLETVRLNPVRELTELCQKHGFIYKKCKDGNSFIEVEVNANGRIYKESRSAANKKTAKRLACKAVLNAVIPETVRLNPVRELTELCQKHGFTYKKHKDGNSFVEVEVNANGHIYKESRSAANRKTAKRLACKAVLDAVIPEAVRLNPMRELTELCQKHGFTYKKRKDGNSFVELEVNANGHIYKESRSAANNKTAKRLACKAVLNAVKAHKPGLTSRIKCLSGLVLFVFVFAFVFCVFIL